MSEDRTDLEEFVTVEFIPAKRIWFKILPIRLSMYRKKLTFQEVQKKRWADPAFRRRRKKKYHLDPEKLEIKKEKLRKYHASEKGQEARVGISQKTKEYHEKNRNKPKNIPRKKRFSPFFMVDGIIEEEVIMDRVDLSHGVVIESQLEK